MSTAAVTLGFYSATPQDLETFSGSDFLKYILLFFNNAQ